MNNEQKYLTLVNKISAMNYGEIITHKETESIIHERYGTSKYNTIITKTYKRLLAMGKMIVNVWKQGYLVADPDAYSQCAVAKIISGGRRITSGQRILQYAPMQNMSENGKKIYQDVSDRVRILNASIGGAVVEVKRLSNKNNPLLPENIQK